MRSRLELSPNQRAIWSVIALALLMWGVGGEHGRFFAALAGFYLILYASAGGRVPWKISWKDYLLYIAISLSLVAAIAVYVLLTAHRNQ